MAKRMLIDAAHPEETRVVVLSGNRLEEFDFESSTKKQVKGNIYLAKVTRVEPSLQAAFVDYGNHRHGFLASSEIHPDYYKIPVGDREAVEIEPLLAEAEVQEIPPTAVEVDTTSLEAALPDPVPVPAAMEGSDGETPESAEPDVLDIADPIQPHGEAHGLDDAPVGELHPDGSPALVELPWEKVARIREIVSESFEAMPGRAEDVPSISAVSVTPDDSIASTEEFPRATPEADGDAGSEGMAADELA